MAGLGGDRDVVHSRCYQIPKATITCRKRGAEGGVVKCGLNREESVSKRELKGGCREF